MENLVFEVQHQTYLRWNYRGLKTLPLELGEVGNHVKEIYLKCNLLQSLPDNMGKLTNLTYCYLSCNNLHSLPDSVGKLVSLQVLDVSNNNLKALPLSLAQLPALRSLVVTNNHLTSFPPELCMLKSLSILMLCGNNLSKLPEDIGKLKGLHGLYVNSSNLKELPRSVTSLPILAQLSVCSNPLDYLPALPFTRCTKIFFENTRNLGHLSLTFANQQRIGNGWNPLVLQSGRCFQDFVVENDTLPVYTGRAPRPLKHPCIILPSQIDKVTLSDTGSDTPPSLKEQCLRHLWKKVQQMKCNNCKELDMIEQLGIKRKSVPANLYSNLEYGPVVFCDNPDCKDAIFTFTSIIVVPVVVVPQFDSGERKVVPLVLYFCGDTCSRQYTSYVMRRTDEFSLWMCDCLQKSICVEIN